MKINGITVLIVCLELITVSFCALNTSSTVTATVSSSKPKTKRGIIHYGNGLPYNSPHITDFSFGLPKPLIATPTFAKFPGIYRNVISPPTIPNYALSHGGAAITSYSINYPRYPILSPKPYFFAPQPALSKPILPTPPFVIPQKPIIPVAISPFANPFSVLSKPFPTPSYAFIPSYPGQTILSPPHHHIHPQFVPIHLPNLPPTVSTFPSTTLPLPGTTIIANAQPTPSSDSWRPVIVTQNPSVIPFQRPAISLLPPLFTQNDRRSAQIEFQSAYDQEFIQPQQLYQRPTSPTLSNIAAAHQHHLNEQGVFDGQQNQQSLHHHHHDITSADLNGQVYDDTSNHGSYTGPSSYEVELNSRTR